MIWVQIREVISMSKQHKQLKTTEMNEAWPDIYDNAKSIIFNLHPLKNFSKALKRHQVWRHPPMENLSNDQEDRSIQEEYNKILRPDHLSSSLKESQWKLRQQLDQNFWREGTPM